MLGYQKLLALQEDAKDADLFGRLEEQSQVGGDVLGLERTVFSLHQPLQQERGQVARRQNLRDLLLERLNLSDAAPSQADQRGVVDHRQELEGVPHCLVIALLLAVRLPASATERPRPAARRGRLRRWSIHTYWRRLASSHTSWRKRATYVESAASVGEGALTATERCGFTSKPQ
jgi:hypothetical protein